MSDRGIYGLWLALTAVIVLGCVTAGCATLEADAKLAAKTVQDKCGPQVMSEALVMIPVMAALADCEYRHEDCTMIRSQMEQLGKADVQACAAALLHYEAVNVAADAGTP